jgi:hypothetical protein
MLDHVFTNDCFDLHLGKKIHNIFGTSVKFGMAFLAAKALDFGDGQAGDTYTSECFADFVQLEWFDNGGDLLHEILLSVSL